MEHAQIVSNGITIAYNLHRSTRARRIRLTVHAGGEVVLTVPARVRWITRAGIDAHAERFVRDHAAWLVRKIDQAARRFNAGGGTSPGLLARLGPADYARHKDRALALARSKVLRFNAEASFGFPYLAVAVRNQRTCWGSCSRKGNLSFNFRMLFLPERVQDYLVVHELCHLREFNHSPKFWALVAQTIPDYAERRRELRSGKFGGLGEG